MKTKILNQDMRSAALAMLAGAALCAGVALSVPAFAADEDTQASVYLVFDPETGEFVTVHDTDGQAKAQETQEAIESVADAGEGIAGRAGADSPAPASAAQSTTSPALMAGLVVAAIAVIGGAVMMMRRS